MFWPEAAPREILQMVIRTMADDAAAEETSEDSSENSSREATPQPAKKSSWPVRPLLSPLEGGTKAKATQRKETRAIPKAGTLT